MPRYVPILRRCRPSPAQRAGAARDWRPAWQYGSKMRPRFALCSDRRAQFMKHGLAGQHLSMGSAGIRPAESRCRQAKPWRGRSGPAIVAAGKSRSRSQSSRRGIGDRVLSIEWPESGRGHPCSFRCARHEEATAQYSFSSKRSSAIFDGVLDDAASCESASRTSSSVPSS